MEKHTPIVLKLQTFGISLALTNVLEERMFGNLWKSTDTSLDTSTWAIASLMLVHQNICLNIIGWQACVLVEKGFPVE